MNSECIFTGALCYFPQYGNYSRGDMHRLGDTYIFYGNPPMPTQHEDVDFIMQVVGFHRETAPYQVWVSKNVRALG